MPSNETRDKTEFVIFIAAIIAYLIVLLSPARCFAQPSPVLRSSLSSYSISNSTPELSQFYAAPRYILMLAWIATDIPDARVYVSSTNSMSPNAISLAPWDLIGEEHAGFALRLIPAKSRDGGVIPGLYVVPVRQLYIYLPSYNQWFADEWMRIRIAVGPPGCSVPACGAVTLIARTPLHDIPTVPGDPVRRRAVINN